MRGAPTPTAATASHTPEALSRGRLAELDIGPAPVPASHPGLCLSLSCLLLGGLRASLPECPHNLHFSGRLSIAYGGVTPPSPTLSAFALFLYPELEVYF